MRKNLLMSMASTFVATLLLVGCGSETGGNPVGNDKSTNDKANGEIQKKIEFNLGHTNSTDNHYHAFAVKLAELVSEKSNGSITINVFPQSQLGGEVSMFQGIREGSVDMLIAGQSALTNTVKELAVMDLPYLFDSVEQANKVLAGDVGKKYLDLLSDYDAKGLGYLSVLQRNVYSNKPINSLADLKGFKIRTAQAPAYMKAYEILGAQPTPMAFSEVYLSLQQGVVDGGEGSPDNYVYDKMVEVAKFYNMTKIHYLPSVFMMSEKKWDGLSPDQQTIIQESVKEALPASFDYYKKSYDESLEKAKELDAKIIEPDLTEFKKEAEKVYDELLSSIPNGPELLKEIQNEASKY